MGIYSKGVSIGDGAVVGMKALVTKSIATKTLNVGSPAQVIKKDINWERGFINK